MGRCLSSHTPDVQHIFSIPVPQLLSAEALESGSSRSRHPMARGALAVRDSLLSGANVPHRHWHVRMQLLERRAHHLTWAPQSAWQVKRATRTPRQTCERDVP
eukprot:5205513-Prymnesium_polylepis.2